jgi:hypothetical protein
MLFLGIKLFVFQDRQLTLHKILNQTDAENFNCLKVSQFQNVHMKNQFHPKYQRKYFWNSALKFFVVSWGLPGSFLGFLGT